MPPDEDTLAQLFPWELGSTGAEQWNSLHSRNPVSLKSDPGPYQFLSGLPTPGIPGPFFPPFSFFKASCVKLIFQRQRKKGVAWDLSTSSSPFPNCLSNVLYHAQPRTSRTLVPLANALKLSSSLGFTLKIWIFHILPEHVPSNKHIPRDRHMLQTSP